MNPGVKHGGMIRRLHERLGISAEVLIRPVRKIAA
jgi:hypothetical protein